MNSLPNPADIRYGGYYLPVLSLLFIHNQIGLPIGVPYADFVITENNFWILFGVPLLGSLVSHGISRSIFGIEGAKNNPKNPTSLRWYRVMLLFKRVPGKPPRNIDEIVSKVVASWDWYTGLSRWNQTKLAIYRAVRYVVFSVGSAGLLAVVIVTTLILGSEAINSGLNMIGGLLLLAQIIFFVGPKIFGRFPTPVPGSSAPWIYLEEYHKPPHLREKGEIELEHGPFEKESVVRKLRQFTDPETTESSDDVEYLVNLEQKSSKTVDENSGGVTAESER